MARANDALSVVTGTLGSQGSLINDLQGLNLDLNRRIQALLEEVGQLKQANWEAERFRADLEIRRAELAHAAKRNEALIGTLKQCVSLVLMEFGPRLRLGGAAVAPVEATEPESPPGARSFDVVLPEVLQRISPATMARVREEVGDALLVELMRLTDK